jgi:endoglucanase
MSGESSSFPGATRRQLLIALAALLAIFGLSLLRPEESTAVRANFYRAPQYFGVNLPSGTFGKARPGTYNKDYVYPDRAIAEPFQVMGLNSIRLGLRWERLQHAPFGPLDALELARLDRTMDELSGFKAIIIDIHNYARYSGMKLDNPANGAALADLWTKLARHYRGNPRAVFGIMNEPFGIDARAWRAVSDQSVAAIRATGARNLVLVPGTRWTGGHSWTKGGSASNAAAMNGFKDPGGNFMFEIHQYLDSNSSGTHPTCVDPTVGRRRLAGVTTWLREQNARGFLAEFGASAAPTCLQSLNDMLSFLEENGDVWAGWTYWAGGARWRNYMFDIQPEGGQPKPQSAILAQHIARYGRAR